MDRKAFDSAVDRVLQAIAAAGIPAATEESDAEAYDAFWSVVARRSGARLHVHTSIDPSTFAAMAHAKPQVEVSVSKLAKGAEAQVLRKAAASLKLPNRARAIPFSLLSGGGANRSADVRICGAAFPEPIDAVVVVWGHRIGSAGSREAIVIGETEIAAFSIDGYTSRFGKVTLRHPITALERADVDDSLLALKLGTTEVSWSLEDAPSSDIDALVALVTRLAIPLRRMVRVDENTRAFELVTS